MANTFDDMVKEVRAKLIGYTLKQDRITYLKASIDAVVTTIPLGSADNLSKGIIEIEDELIWIDSFDTPTMTLNAVPGFGRGFQGTTPATHNINSQVILTPPFPRNAIKKAINDTIQAVYPKIFAVKHTTLTSSAIVNTFALPTDVWNVIGASYQTVGPWKEWKLIKRYRTDSMANNANWATTNTISIYDPIISGRTIDVAYTAQPTQFSVNADDFVTVTGLPITCWDIIVLGACSRMLAFIDAGRINTTSAESDLADSKVPTTAGQTLGKFVYALYQQRLTDESSKMISQYRSTPHYIN